MNVPTFPIVLQEFSLFLELLNHFKIQCPFFFDGFYFFLPSRTAAVFKHHENDAEFNK